jgi:hypothetical protein
LKVLAAAAFIAFVPLAVCANVPPMSWQPQTYVGPGLFCGENFTFQLEAGEKATLGFPSEGYLPTSIRTAQGVFGIVVYSFNTPVVEKTLITHASGGDVYIVDRMVRDAASGIPKRRSYWFEPRGSGRPFSLDFYAAVEGRQGWSEFPPSSYASVVKRVSFAGEPKNGACLDSSAPGR